MVVIARLQSALEAEINDNTQLRLAKDNIHNMYITVRRHSILFDLWCHQCVWQVSREIIERDQRVTETSERMNRVVEQVSLNCCDLISAISLSLMCRTQHSRSSSAT